jgi:hypothetical protein
MSSNKGNARRLGSGRRTLTSESLSCNNAYSQSLATRQRRLPSPRPKPSGQTGGRSTGGIRAAGASAALAANAWDRGVVTLPESEAAPTSRNAGQLGFIVGQRMRGSTPWNKERTRIWHRGGWSATRGVAGARRNGLATEAAARGIGWEGKERGWRGPWGWFRLTLFCSL